MRGRDFLEKMDLVDPIYVEGADEMPIIRVKRWPKAVVAAACLCLVAWGAWGLSGGFGREMRHMAGPGASETPEVSIPPSEILYGPGWMSEHCPGVLGLEDCWVAYEGTPDAANWWYYTLDGNGRYKLIARSWWNAKSAAPYEVDLDGDGVKELIFNLHYENGWQEIQIIRNRGGQLENGCLDNDFLRDHWQDQGLTPTPGGYESIRSYYDPDRGIVLEADCLDEAGNEAMTVDVYQDLAHFNFYIDEDWTLRNGPMNGVEPSDVSGDDVASIAPEPCPDTLGFTNCVVCLKREPELTHWWYYTCEDGEYRLIAYTFGFGDQPDAYRADLDGDGVDELICNAEWTDGAREVLVYRSRDGVIEQGRIDSQYWKENGLEAVGYSIYDPEQGFIITANDLKDSGWTVTLQGLEHFVFQTFEIQAGDPLFPQPDAPASGG